MSSTGGKKRIRCLDYSKGIAILLLLLSHCMSGSSILKTWIFSFHMPIFFIICGILAAGNYPDGIRVNRLGNYLKKRCIQLLLPYFIWGGVLIAYYQFLNIISGQKLTVWNQLISLISLQGIDSLWFIPVYFFAEMAAVFIIMRLNAKLQILINLCGICLLIVINDSGIPENSLIRFALKILIGMIFIYIGVIIKKFAVKRTIPVVVLIVCLLAGSGLAVYNGFAAIGSLELQNVILFFADASLISIAVIGIFKHIDEKITGNLKALRTFGENTIVVLCTNNILIECIRLLDHKITGDILLKWGMGGSFLLAFIIGIIEAGLIKTVDSPVGILFGKRNFMK